MVYFGGYLLNSERHHIFNSKLSFSFIKEYTVLYFILNIIFINFTLTYSHKNISTTFLSQNNLPHFKLNAEPLNYFR